MIAPSGQARVCIYTAIFGGYDELKPQPEQTIQCDFVCFTDNPATGPVAPWRVVQLEPMADNAPRLRAKLPKVLPHTVFDP